MRVVWCKNVTGRIDTIMIRWEWDLEDVNVELSKARSLELWKIKIQNIGIQSVSRVEYYATLIAKAIEVAKRLDSGTPPERICEGIIQWF